ncbi:SixA phosphatase family protein [Janibacter cremeus]|uniref:Phosphohistidine phosphatase n=1 Tax=Janibacter cremeus TaxID=1285192 RepID=A0A852VJK8_9MICO|nr:histidine phosphatase family protein [Janibacter cremeus]NYF97252.1 phosphohistidine phosphatase [Janibacter cremeus]
MTTSAEDRTLVLLRHASAESASAGQDDRERSLTDAGREEAQDVGRWLVEQGIGCDEVMCSPAQRTRETMAEIAAGGCAEAEVEIEHRLYNAGAEEVLAVVREAREDASVLLVVGHAPGLPAAASLLADGDGSAPAHDLLAEGFPPGAVAVLRYCGPWTELAFDSATLDRFHVPVPVS